MKRLLLPLAILAILAVCLFFPLLISGPPKTPESQASAPQASAPAAEPTAAAAPTATPPAESPLAQTPDDLPVIAAQGGPGTQLQISGRPTQEKYFDFFAPQSLALSFDEKLQKLRSLFPQGKYWNSMDSAENLETLTQEQAATIVTDTPCQHTEIGYDVCHEYDGEVLYGYYENIQCLGFASLISDFLFGKDAPLYEFYRIEDLKPGDHIRYNDYDHSMIVTQVLEDAVEVVECNRDYETCLIEWDRRVSHEELLGYDVVFYTRTAADYALPVGEFDIIDEDDD